MKFDCVKCRGSKNLCNRNYCPLYKQFKLFQTKDINISFSGSSPPDIFVGQYNYPNVFSGILSPVEHNNESYKLSDPEEWFKAGLSSDDILMNRSQLIYSRFVNNIKSHGNKLSEVMQEISMAYKPCDVEFNLKKKPVIKLNTDNISNPLGNIAPLRRAKIVGNIKVARKVDYFVDDKYVKAESAMVELHKHDFKISSIIKLLSAGLLGIKNQRKLTPSKWATTAVDSIISNNLLKKIRNYSWINDIIVFSDEYLENHYEILLLPRSWSFEVIESKFGSNNFWQDYEIVFNRKKYASSVTGAYYSNRIACCEYLERIKRQASVIFFREIKDYEAPLGVGILREVSRNAFKKKGRKFNNLRDAFEDIQSRMKSSLSNYINKSKVIEEYMKQSDLRRFI